MLPLAFALGALMGYRHGRIVGAERQKVAQRVAELSYFGPLTYQSTTSGYLEDE